MPSPNRSAPRRPRLLVAASGALPAAAFGAAIGTLGYFGWYLCAPRSIGVLGLTPTTSGHQAFTFDHLAYVAGPAVVPPLIYLVALGSATAVVLWLAVRVCGRNRRRLQFVSRKRPDLMTLGGFSAATGAVTGVATAMYSEYTKPLVVAKVALAGGESTPAGYPVVGGPPMVEAGPLAWTFPLAGIVLGLVIAFATNAVISIASRTVGRHLSPG